MICAYLEIVAKPNENSSQMIRAYLEIVAKPNESPNGNVGGEDSWKKVIRVTNGRWDDDQYKDHKNQHTR